MKRGTIEHPKMIMLASKLSCPRYAAVGIMECLWHFTSRYAPQGDVGKYSDQVIADSVGFQNDPKILISALIECKFLQIEKTHRLIIHDWSHHADDAVNKYLKRRKLRFADGLKPFAKVGTKARHRRDDVTNESRPIYDQPEPLPLPTPEPLPTPTTPFVQEGSKKTKIPLNTKQGCQFDAFWKCYPKRIGKGAAWKSWDKIKPDDETFRSIIDAVDKQRRSDQWTRDDGQYIPMPATWLNQERWNDEGVEKVKELSWAEKREAARQAMLTSPKRLGEADDN